jgi:hypothetical protein
MIRELRAPEAIHIFEDSGAGFFTYRSAGEEGRKKEEILLAPPI